jgi:hypothetical protein
LEFISIVAANQIAKPYKQGISNIYAREYKCVSKEEA